MEEELKSIKLSIHGLLTANKSGVSSFEIEDLYKMLLGSELPYKKYNCRNLEEFISKYMSEDTYIRNVNGQNVFLPVMKEESKHVAMLINRTKDSKKPKKVTHVKKPLPPRLVSEKKSVALGNSRSNPAVNEKIPAPRFCEKRPAPYVGGGGPNRMMNEKISFANVHAPREDMLYNKSDIPSNKARDARHCEFPSRFHDNPRATERMTHRDRRDSNHMIRHESYKYGDAQILQGPRSYRGDAFHGHEEREEERPQMRNVADVNKQDSRNELKPRPEGARDPSPPTGFNGSQHVSRDFSNMTISVTTRNSDVRLVEFGDGPSKQSFKNDHMTIKKGSLPYMSSANHLSAERGDQPYFERHISLDDQGRTRFNVFGSGDFNDDLRNLAGSQASDRTGKSFSKSGSTNLYSVMTSPLEERSRSMMTSPFSQAKTSFGKSYEDVKSPQFFRQVSDSGMAKGISQFSSPVPNFKPFAKTDTRSTLKISEDPSIIPPVTSPSKSASHFNFADTSKMMTFTSVLPYLPQDAIKTTSGPKFAESLISTRTNTSQSVQQPQSKDEENQMIIVTEVHTTSLVLGHFKCSGDPVSFALTNLDDISEVDLEYVRILLLNRCFRAAFDYNSSNCFGTLYKKNDELWINMNLFMLEETLDPVYVRKDPQGVPTYTVSELFSIRKKSRSYRNPELIARIRESEVALNSPPTNKADDIDKKLAILHSWDDNGKIWLDFFSLDEVEPIAKRKKKDSKPVRLVVDGRTRVGCFLRGFARDEVEWTPSKLMRMREVLRQGSKVLVKIFERRCSCDRDAFSVDLRLLGQCSFMTDVFKREPSASPLWKVAQVEMPGKGERILITKVRSLQHINAIRVEHLESFGKLFVGMQEFYDKKKDEDVPNEEAIIKKYLYGYRSNEDGLWYRGRVEDMKENSRVLVYNVDFGSYETLPENSLRTLPNGFRNLPLMSCYLKLNSTFKINETVHDLEEKILNKVFRYFPSKLDGSIAGVLLSCHDNTPIIS